MSENFINAVQCNCNAESLARPFLLEEFEVIQNLRKTRGFLGRDKELRYVYRLVMVLRLSGVQFIQKWYEWWQNWTTAQRESDLFSTSIISDLIGRHEVLSPINHKNYNYREKEYGQVMKERKNLHKQNDTSVLKVFEVLHVILLLSIL